MGRKILFAIVPALLFQGTFADTKKVPRIDRYALVSRHNVSLSAFNALAPLSVGNGRFTFTADLTGLQSFPGLYQNGIPLNTMSEWGWHSFANTENYKLEDTFVQVETCGRPVPYNLIRKSPAADYLRANPHRTNLAQVGFVLLKADGSAATTEDLKDLHQSLDLWRGILNSTFELDGCKVEVETLCHPDLDMLAVSVRFARLGADKLRISLRFPYATGQWGPVVSNWDEPDKHTTKVLKNDKHGALLLRQMDNLEYYCILKYSPEGELREIEKHSYQLIPTVDVNSFDFCMLFSQKNTEPPGFSFQQTKDKCENYWKKFWTTGAAIDLSKSKDPRWKELERRIVLSQYLTAIQSAQNYPPAETGLTCNSWFGKFHLEMHWWHGVHFALWDRLGMFEKSLGWYKEILPVAKGIAQRQGYEGVRWPKMVGPAGQDAPSDIGPLLIWQQSHPIYYAELVYRHRPTKQTLEKYRDIVQQSAEFMASFTQYNKKRKCFELGPPLLSAREFNVSDYARIKNPAFELAYWAWGLDKANQWRQRLGFEREPKWDNIIENLAPLPVHNGIYVEQETPLVADGGHPSMLAAYGFLPQTHLLDEETMRKTLQYVVKDWDYKETWGWDYPMIAMTAARLGQPDIAVDALLMDTPKNTYLPNGHNYQTQDLPVYLPGNGGLLTAVAMMSAGWDDCPDRSAPGFPNDGQWTIRWENLKKMP
jgi:hypothetical protein